MQLHEWMRHYLKRNASIKGWKVSCTSDHDCNVHTPHGERRYLAMEHIDLSSVESNSVIVAANTEKNILSAIEDLDSLTAENVRILFVNPTSDQFWTLNVDFVRKYSNPETVRAQLKHHVGDVPFV